MVSLLPIWHRDRKWNEIGKRKDVYVKAVLMLSFSIAFYSSVELNLSPESDWIKQFAWMNLLNWSKVAQTVYIHIGCNATWISFGPSIFTNESQVYLGISLLTFVYGGLLSVRPMDYLTTQVPKTTKILYLESENFKEINSHHLTRS